MVEDKVRAVIAHPTGEFRNEKYRPQFHFTPDRNWMNDPNGLVYYKGKYHLFFQHNPQANIWGNMSWGHATSTDLYNWHEEPVAIACTPTSGIFSGSAVVDINNTSGFGTTDNPPIVAIYTEHQNNESNQSQCLAFSVDEGATFTKYEGNPVLDIKAKNFRDPKVQWIDNQWIMTVALANDYKISFYSSPDLKSWTHLSNFGPAAEVGGVWECPDLIKFEGEWVLLVSLNPGGYQIGSGTQYFIGQWNGKEFIADDLQTRWLDYGRDNYAGVTFSNAPDGKKIFLGWMSNWHYAGKVPTDPWRSAMTLPRELSLQGDRIIQTPVIHPSGFPEVSFTTEDGAIRICESNERYVEIGVRNQKLYVDTSHAWNDLDAPTLQEIAIEKGEIDIRVIVDRGSVEVFAAGGAIVLTNLVFVETALTTVAPLADANNLKVAGLQTTHA
jgi:sucrose-6-phosphate hydrolase SacC (GH32 family)